MVVVPMGESGVLVLTYRSDSIARKGSVPWGNDPNYVRRHYITPTTRLQ
jgi:hypothetical protein